MFHAIAEFDSKTHECTLENGSRFLAFEVDLFDQETLGLDRIESCLRSLLHSLSPNETLKFILKAQFSNETSPEHSRATFLKSVGHIQRRGFLIFQKEEIFKFSIKQAIKAAAKPLNFNTDLLKDLGVNCRPLVQTEIENILPKLDSEISHRFRTIDTGSELVSLLRLTKASEFRIDSETLSLIKDQLPLPHTIVCTVQTVGTAHSEALLRRKSKQNETGADLKQARKHQEAQTDLEDVALNGSKLFRFEWLCLVNRSQESWLRLDLEEARRTLSPLGDIAIESVGALQSLKACYPGEPPHFTLLEKDLALAAYLPLVTRGESSLSKPLSRSLALHRRDESLCYVDIFNPSYESFSWCIFGRPGTGKSVLVNSITRALANDPNIKIIKIDVGGSHSRETELLGGVEKTLSLNEPTGLNPFNILAELGSSKESLQILSSFLEVLILEEGETKLSKSLKSALESAISNYSEMNRPDPSLQDFFDQVQNLPRRDLLRRWVHDGVYGNAFSTAIPSGREVPSSRLTYYNFSKISQAMDPDYAQGGLAAVMAQFNYEILKKEKDQKRIVFIADETPFFIKKCFNFFNLSIANIRKEGHGFITVAQKSSHVVIDGDNGILDNSPNKIIFSVDGDDESFASRTQLSLDATEKIKKLQRQQGEYSEAFLKDNKGERVLKIRLSPEEYWAYTSKDTDKARFREIQSAFPNIPLKDLIQCLAMS